MKIRTLARHELGDLWSIDRAEVIDGLYRCVDGALVLGPVHYDVPGWPPGTAERTGPSLLDRFNRGGTFFGAFEGGALVGAAVLESRFIGPAKDQLQLVFLHVGRAQRRIGLGKALFAKAVARARELGARRLYVFATPSENTANLSDRSACASDCLSGRASPPLRWRPRSPAGTCTATISSSSILSRSPPGDGAG